MIYAEVMYDMTSTRSYNGVAKKYIYSNQK